MEIPLLPTLNALLNVLATVLLLRGRALVRQGRIAAHRSCMLAAFATSSLFLALYVIHKASRNFENTSFLAEGLGKQAYLALLISHVSLAMTVPLLAILLIRWGLRGEIARHRRLARVAWPIWIYVSLTGVAIYVLLYWVNPSRV